jgi:ATP-dependent RNA helicase RhlE
MTATTTMIALVLLLTGPGSAVAFLTPSGSSARLRNSNIPISRLLLSAQTAVTTSATNEWKSLTVIQLKDLLREKGLKTSGLKSELILRLHVFTLQASPGQQGQPLPQQSDFEAQVVRAPKTRKITSGNVDNDTSSNNGFQDINVPPRLVARLRDMGMNEPTPIQKEAIPKAIVGRDVMGLAQTGTGKTLAFGIPLVAQMLNNNSSRPKPKSVRGLVLAPTRELANQIAVQLKQLTEGTPIGTMVVVGGKNIQTQTNKLKTGTDLLVATPGRLIDLMDRRALTLTDTTFLVLDEADLMLDIGFLPSLRKLEKMLPKKRQTMLFSATMSKNMNEVASSYLKNPVRVEVARAGKTADKVTQQLHYIAKPDKGDKLISLLRDHKEDRALVFGRTKHGMEKLSKKLIAAGFKAGSIHGNKSQPQRDRAIELFKSGAIKVLVATDVAARGLDIPDVKHVYNYELPNIPEAYVHRIGRTARAGKEGAAVAFCSMEEMDDLVAIQKVTGLTIPVVSGSPWSKTEARPAKNSINENKQENQEPKSSKKKKKSSRGPSLTRYSRR